MMPKSRRPRGEAPDVVDRTRAGVDRAIIKLVGLLIVEEPGVAEKAHRSLHRLGADVVLGPLLTILDGKFSATLKTAVLIALDIFGPEYNERIGVALNRALMRKQDIQVVARMQMLALKKWGGVVRDLQKDGAR